jgi:hypothetical protein
MSVHQPPHTSTSRPCRGTIIVDASTLLKLAYSISNKYSNAPELSQNDYQYLLQFLTDHGYRILIPETVALEAGHVTADGIALQRLSYPQGKERNFRRASSFLKSIANARDQVTSWGGEIRIVADTGPKEADEYCKKVRISQHNISTDPFFRPNGKQSSQSGNYKKPQAFRDRLSSIRHTTETEHLGDKAVVSLLRKEQQTPAGNILVLSDDHALCDQIWRDHNTMSMSAEYFVFAFMAAGLGAEAGFSADVKPEKMVDDLIEKNPCYRINGEYNPAGSGRLSKAIANYPFYASLQELKKDLEEKARAEAATPPEEKNEGAQRFAKRFGNPLKFQRPRTR